MPAASETRQYAEALQGFASDDEVMRPLSIGDDSILDTLPCEDLEFSDIYDTPDVVELEDVIVPVTLGPTTPTRLRLKSLPDVHCVMDWIMGRNLTIEEDPPSGECISRATEMRKTGLREKGEDYIGRQKLVDDDFLDIGDVKDICPACTTPYCQAIDSLPFKGSLKLSYNDPEKHTWAIGDKYVMTEAVDDEGPERTEVTLVLATELLRASTNVPVPNVLAGWKEDGKVITIAERVPGQRLYDIWWDLGHDEREQLAKEVISYVDQWRQVTADTISGLGGGPVWRHDQLFGARPEGFGPFKSDEQLWDAIHDRLVEKKVDEGVIQTLRDYIPESAPCVLTHGDLSCVNILVHNGRVSAILAFDNAACLPIWAEHVAAHLCYCKEDEQWKALLSRHMKTYPRAKDWFALWWAVENNGSDKKRVAALVARCRRWERPPERNRPFDPEASDDERMPYDPPYEPSSSDLVPGPPLRSPRRYGYQVKKTRGSFEAALSRKLLKGKHYSDLLIDPYWQSAVRSQSAESEIHEIDDEALAALERQMEAERIRRQNSRERHREEAAEDRPQESRRRISIERWLSESVRGRKALRPLIIQRMSDGKGETTPYLSPTKSPPWRERQRSFERGENAPRGLRPFSLTQSGLSENVKKNLEEIGEEEDKGRLEEEEEEEEKSGSREKALRSLEGGREDEEAATAADPAEQSLDKEQARRSLASEGKRTSIFRQKTTPGSLYLAVANVGAEVKSRRHGRSRSEEQASTSQEDQASSSQLQHQRPQSLVPQSGGIRPGSSMAE
ncbi:hypothetical protein F4804DRAFT_308784 [Jackrogersella minutella]|nr:hypothetical protein F4804DRAFT_308784 [Jackrogersella minutella]